MEESEIYTGSAELFNTAYVGLVFQAITESAAEIEEARFRIGEDKTEAGCGSSEEVGILDDVPSKFAANIPVLGIAELILVVDPSSSVIGAFLTVGLFEVSSTEKFQSVATVILPSSNPLIFPTILVTITSPKLIPDTVTRITIRLSIFLVMTDF